MMQVRIGVSSPSRGAVTTHVGTRPVARADIYEEIIIRMPIRIVAMITIIIIMMMMIKTHSQASHAKKQNKNQQK